MAKQEAGERGGEDARLPGGGNLKLGGLRLRLTAGTDAGGSGMDSPDSPPGLPDVYQPPAAKIELPPEPQEGSLSPAAMKLLSQSRWGMKVVAIALMLNAVLSVVAAVIVAVSGLQGARKGLLFLVVMVIAVVVFVPGLRLMQSARGVTRSLSAGDERQICAALERHQQFWVWFGIVLILLGGLFFFLSSFQV